jgi:hypothetical protein
MTTLSDIAAEYKRAACLVTGDGREWWRVEADRQVWLFMVEAARLAEAREAYVAALERQLDAQRRGELAF